MIRRQVVSYFTVGELGVLLFRYALRSSQIKWTFLLLWAVFAIVYIPWSTLGLIGMITSLLIGALVCCVSCVGGCLISVLCSIRRIRRYAGKKVFYANEQGISEYSRLINLSLPWASIESVIWFSQYIVIQTKIPNDIVALKRRGFESEQAYEAFYQEIKGLIGQKMDTMDKQRIQLQARDAEDKIALHAATIELTSKLGRAPTLKEVEQYRWLG